jgi:hypothetical protein
MRKGRNINRTSAVGLALVVGVAAASISAAAAGAGTHAVVAKGPITTTTAKVGAASVAPAVPLGAQVIFSNFGPPGNAYNAGVGWTVSEPGSPPGLFQNANAFTPSVGSQVTRIDLALTHVSGVNNAVIKLATDNGGIPGTVLGSFFVFGQPPFGTCCAVTTVNVSPIIPVAAGHKYWVVAVAGPNGANNTWDAWQLTYNGASTGAVKSWNGSTWLDFTGDPSGAFDVIGCGKLCKVFP